MTPLQKRFYRAMGAYVAIATLAGFTLDGTFRLAIWILMAGFAAKTLIHHKTSDL